MSRAAIEFDDETIDRIAAFLRATEVSSDGEGN